MIGKKLDTRMDVYRFRSVCKSWRSSVPPVSEFELRIGGALIGQRMVYLLEPPPSFPEDPLCPPAREGWLIKVAENEGWLIKVAEKVTEDEDLSGRGKVQLFNPLSSQPIFFKGGTFPKVLCPIDYRVSQIFAERYREDGESYPELSKVIILPDSPWAVLEKTLVVGIFGKGKLYCWKHGDENWNTLDHPNRQYDDLIAYKGQFYVVDRFGVVSWIDPSFKIVQFSPPVYGYGDGGDRKHLVELGGDLYVVDRYFNEEDKLCGIQVAAMDTADLKVYRLNQEWGRWDEISNLGEVALFLGDHSCFSVPVKGFGGCKGSCIYFPEGSVQVFNMENRRIKMASDLPDHRRILWPPPAWIAPNGFSLNPYWLEEPMLLVDSDNSE